ncbi:MAG: ECF transporter S component [Lachnospiraceae bacterium]|nr:ECF transporter S component [Lachnospiraceae bacterium]
MKTKQDEKKFSVMEIAITGVCIALTFVMTFINLRLPIAANGGLVHLGNVPLFLAAILFGKRTGALAGGIGMALFDLMGGWVLWAPFTLVVVGLMGYVVGKITEKHTGFTWNLLAMVAACVIKIVGYYIAEGIIYGNWIAPVTSIPGNLVQVTVAMIIVLPVAEVLRRAVRTVRFS